MRFEIKDPLEFVIVNGGQVSPPANATGANGGKSLDYDQRSVELGEPVPIVFARRINNQGGVLVSPGASEARFENGFFFDNPALPRADITAYYLLPLSEGVLDDIPVKDVFQAVCRVGFYTQTYNRRAGTWVPGNFISPALPGFVSSEFRSEFELGSFPQFCGSVGIYPNITTLSFENTAKYLSTDWKNKSWAKQVHIFIRGGMHVTRLIDNVTGPSNNFADLAKWLLLNSGRIPAMLVDSASLLKVATFLNANNFNCDIWIQEGAAYEEFVGRLAPYFLLRSTKVNGKRGLVPLLPVNANGTINVSPINWTYIFTEELIVPGSFEMEYAAYAERQPFVAQMTWRQQSDDDIGIVRTAEVRYTGTAIDGPYESHDLSSFCTNENHAVKVGTYILSNRVNSTHVIRFTAKPEAHTYLLSAGSIIRVNLDRYASGSNESEFDFLYTIIKSNQTSTGEVSYECLHLPIDEQGRSIVALDVAAAVGTGFTIVTTRTGVSCDAPMTSGGGGGSGGGGRQDEETIPAEEYIEPNDSNDPSIWNEGDLEYEWLINGDPLPGETNENYTPELDYQWYLDGTPISGATDEEYTPVSGDIGDELVQQITYPGGAVYDSAPYEAVAENVGQPLNLISSTWGEAEPVIYQWFLNGSLVSGATGETYTPVSGDIGAILIQRATYPDRSVYESAPYTILASDVGQPLNLINWPLVPEVEEYQWYLDNTPISGATGETYTPVSGDVGDELVQQATYPDGSVYESAPYEVEAGDVGQPLELIIWPLIPEVEAYTWYLDGDPIGGATGSSYTPVSGDIGGYLQLEATYVDNSVFLTDPVTVTDAMVGTPVSYPTPTVELQQQITYPDGTVLLSGPVQLFPKPEGSGSFNFTNNLPGGTSSALLGGASTLITPLENTLGSIAIANDSGYSISDGDGSGPTEASENPEDELDNPDVPTGPQPQISGTPTPGNTLTYDPGCPGAFIEWRLIDNATGQITVVSSGVAAPYIVGGESTGKSVVGVGRCPDPSSPDGFGPEIVSPPVTDPFTSLPPGNWTQVYLGSSSERSAGTYCNITGPCSGTFGSPIVTNFGFNGVFAPATSSPIVAVGSVTPNQTTNDSVCGGPSVQEFTEMQVTVKLANGSYQTLGGLFKADGPIARSQNAGPCFGNAFSDTRTSTYAVFAVKSVDDIYYFPAP